MTNGSAIIRPPSAPIFIVNMKGSKPCVYMNFAPLTAFSSRKSGSQMKAWMRSTKKNAITQPKTRP